MTYILLIVGFILLVKGAGFLVDGASSVAKKLNVSNLVIGLTVVAFGTSAPELFVNLFASFNGTTDIAIGNIVGSNIVNILFILGISAIIFPLKVTKGTTWKEIPMCLLAVVLVLIMANDGFVDGSSFNALTRIDGFVLISFFIIFLYYTFGIAKNKTDEEIDETPKTYSTKWSVFLILAGLAGLVVGGQFIVNSAVSIASNLGLSDALIGLTIIAIGTSLPELATSVVAALKKNADIAVGNIVGSGIFNVFWILGISSVINPLPFKPELNFDLWVVVFATALLFVWMFLGKRHTLERWQGVLFVFLYIAYTIIIVMRG
jgi:cation:H+ antiporter